MKGILKFFPVALGALALASCSNEDMFFGNENVSNKLQLIASVEEPIASDDDAVTRAAWYGSNLNAIWQAGDQFRVYDEAVQKYDNFVCKVNGETKTIELADASAKAETHAYAIFPGEKVSYAGYDRDEDALTALMSVPATVVYGGQEVSGENTGYVSALPMWGEVTEEDGNLKAPLKHLTAYTDITIYKDKRTPIKRIRVVSAAEGKAAKDFATDAAVNAKNTPTNLNANAPLTGYFNALLKDGGQLVPATESTLAAAKGSVITVEGIDNMGDEAHIIIPIIAQSYKNLIILKSTADADDWTELKSYTNTTVKNNVVIRKGLTVGTAPAKACVNSLADLNTKLTTIANSYNGQVVDIDVDGEIATVAGDNVANQSIVIPNTMSGCVLNIKGTVKNEIANKPLTISGGGDSNSVTINFVGGVKGNQKVVVNTENGFELKLAGTIASTGSGDLYASIDVKSPVTLGLGEYAPFNTALKVISNNAAVTVDAGTGTIAAIDMAAAANNAAIAVNSGTVTAIGGNVAAASAVTVNEGAKVGSITNAAAAVTVAAGAEVGTITTATTGNKNTISLFSSVETLNVSGAAPKITLTGVFGKDAKTVKIGTLAATNSKDAQTITLTSTNKTAVVNFTKANNGTSFAAASTSNVSVANTPAANIKAAADEVGADGMIFTVSQLAAVTTGKDYTLAIAVKPSNVVWAGVNLNGTFDGNGKALAAVSGDALFNTISGGTVKDLTINLVTNDANDAAVKGGLANTVTGTTTIKDVTISGAIGKGTANKNTATSYGGLIGKANGAITLQDNKVTATVKGYAKLGGLIGEVAGGSVNILSSKSDGSKASEITFTQTMKPTNIAKADGGTIGNIIGSITGTNVSVNIGGTEDGKGGNLAQFINTTNGVKDNTTDLGYSKNTNSADKAFIGMQGTVNGQELGYEIGYSTGSIQSLTLYNKTKTDLGVAYSLTIDDINQYAE